MQMLRRMADEENPVRELIREAVKRFLRQAGKLKEE